MSKKISDLADRPYAPVYRYGERLFQKLDGNSHQEVRRVVVHRLECWVPIYPIFRCDFGPHDEYDVLIRDSHSPQKRVSQ